MKWSSWHAPPLYAVTLLYLLSCVPCHCVEQDVIWQSTSWGAPSCRWIFAAALFYMTMDRPCLVALFSWRLWKLPLSSLSCGSEAAVQGWGVIPESQQSKHWVQLPKVSFLLVFGFCRFHYPSLLNPAQKDEIDWLCCYSYFIESCFNRLWLNCCQFLRSQFVKTSLWLIIWCCWFIWRNLADFFFFAVRPLSVSTAFLFLVMCW